MSDRLRLLQAFTTDPKLLHEAASKTMVVGQVHADRDPKDDPRSLSALIETVPSTQLPPGALQALMDFEEQTFAFNLGYRVSATLDALRGLARYLNGFPGRKNVLWISTAFPLVLDPGDASSSDRFSSSLQEYLGDMQEVGSSLMDGKIAIYPVDAGGVRTQSMFEASAIVRQPWNAQRMGHAIQREDAMRMGAQQVMRDLADQTGGRVCIGDNDFADCVKKAVEDASAYYELAYYPDQGNWSAEYHRIVLKTTRAGVHLWFREGYYARPLPSTAPGSAPVPRADEMDPALRRAACEDSLNATGILVMAQAMSSEKPETVRYFFAIDPHMVTFTAPEGGVHQLGITLAACTFDKTGHPMQYYQMNSSSKLNREEFAAATHALTETFQLDAKPNIARVRLLVRDTVSGG